MTISRIGKIVISITMFAGQDVAKMMIVRVSFVIKAMGCVYQVIPKIKQLCNGLSYYDMQFVKLMMIVN